MTESAYLRKYPLILEVVVAPSVALISNTPLEVVAVVKRPSVCKVTFAPISVTATVAILCVENSISSVTRMTGNGVTEVVSAVLLAIAINSGVAVAAHFVNRPDVWENASPKVAPSLSVKRKYSKGG